MGGNGKIMCHALITETENNCLCRAGKDQNSVEKVGEKTETERRGDVEKLCLLIGGVLGRHPGSSALQLFTSVLTPPPPWREGEGGREEGGRGGGCKRMLLSEDLSSLATQPAQGKEGRGHLWRKEMRKKDRDM